MTIFVDTNVLVYARDGSEPVKQPLAHAWMKRLWESSLGRTSVQVLNELYVTLTHKLDPGMAAADARAEIDDLEAWRPRPLDADLMAAAWTIEDRFGFSFWDALVVAAAQASGCNHLLTEDLQDGQDLDGVAVVDPFSHTPDELIERR